MAISPEAVLQALRTVQDPDLHRDIVALGFVKDLEIEGESVKFKVELTTPACPVKEDLKRECEEAVGALPGVGRVEVEMTAQVRSRPETAQDLIPGVRQCIAIASGKGGVGKSTVAVNVAVALAQEGARVGLMDADVYGPSVPLMMGIPDERPMARGQRIIPIERFGVRIMSLGLLLEEGQAVLWRGPMVAGTVRQLLADVDWGELDYLLVDLPPGTGDAPMSLAQLVPLAGVVIVTTPHHVAANIAGKAASLFRRLNSTVIGVVENMATHVCPGCGRVSRLFAGATGEELAASLDVPFLGSIPLDEAVGAASLEGLPSILASPNRPQANAFRQIARQVAAGSSVLAMEREARDAAKAGGG
ncbi:MAG: Mrp/NBP35 family ATP-binding protein [Fimbriimonadaceae bacterium]|nr:Mrp/NBP35 family ATP-binding protein [Fimbriimonadaceae bacterium]QYK54836.1 MAG: Mrp/NBP35 family ATP-binding protein [Fimbriimonadaceae bacterium]